MWGRGGKQGSAGGGKIREARATRICPAARLRACAGIMARRYDGSCDRGYTHVDVDVMGEWEGPHLADFFSAHAGQEHDQPPAPSSACRTGASLVITSHGMRKRLPAD